MYLCIAANVSIVEHSELIAGRLQEIASCLAHHFHHSRNLIYVHKYNTDQKINQYLYHCSNLFGYFFTNNLFNLSLVLIFLFSIPLSTRLRMELEDCFRMEFTLCQSYSLYL